jgi:predicted MFS family arabinose efflux permease
MRWLILLSSFLSTFSFLFSLQSFPPILPDLVHEFGIGYGSASSLMWLVALPGIFLSILGGIMVARYGVKRTCILGLGIVTGSSVLSVISNSYSLLQFSRLVLGIGGALVFVSSPVLIFQWFERSELGIAMGIFGLNMPLATVISFNVLSTVALMSSWRNMILLATTVNASILLICIFSIREKGHYTPSERSTFKPLGNWNIWILGAVWGFFNMAAIGYTTWGKTIFMLFKDLSFGFSDFLASLLMFGALITPLTGFISDRTKVRRSLILVSSLVMFAIFLVFPLVNKSLYLPLALILGLSAAFLPPAVFALPEEILGVGKGAVGFGVLNTCLNTGIALGPLFVGYTLDLTHNEIFTFLVMSAFMFISLVLALSLKST